jgi:hypothetical protein
MEEFEEACREHDLDTIMRIGKTESTEAFGLTFIKGFNPEISMAVLPMGNFDLGLAYFYLCDLGGESVYGDYMDYEHMLMGCEWLYNMGIRYPNLLQDLCEVGNILMVKWALTKPEFKKNLQKCRTIAKNHGFDIIADLLN